MVEFIALNSVTGREVALGALDSGNYFAGLAHRRLAVCGDGFVFYQKFRALISKNRELLKVNGFTHEVGTVASGVSGERLL